MQTMTYVKLAIVGLALAGGFALVLAGKLDAATMFDKTSGMIGALVVALGLSAAGGAIAGKMGGSK